MFLVNIIFSYLIPIIYNSMAALLMVLFFLFIFRVKDPTIRTALFFIPLIKPFIMIIERIDLSNLYFQNKALTLGVRFPDPTNMINWAESRTKGPVLINSQNDLIILIIIGTVILVFLIARWISLALFYKNLAYEEKVTRTEVPALYSIIDKYSTIINAKVPDVSLTHKDYYSPFVVGLKNSTLVLSPKLLEILNDGEREIIIHHEISHIKRNDNLVGWIALILRDLNFFNPFGYISYCLIRAEQERGSDLLTVKYSGKKPKEIINNIINSIIKLRKIDQKSKELVPNHGSNFFTRTISKTKLNNRIKNILNSGNQRIYSKIVPKILLYFLFAFILLIQIFFVVKINNFTFILR
jgi:beta-lactamase regulating signal transducer with metallopeptidase domain